MMMTILILLMIAAFTFALLLFSNTGSLLMVPLTQPGEFLAGMPHANQHIFGWQVTVIQPSSTILVYFLGLLMTALGVTFLVTHHAQWARRYWGWGLVLWGISALLAGSSYQAFGYELKCRGRDFCLFTSDFELLYLLLMAYSINFLVAATGYTSLHPSHRRGLLAFALVDSLAYSIYLLVGAILPVRFLASYDGFMAFIGFNFLLMFILNVRHYQQKRDGLNRNLMIIWLGFLFVNLGYFASLFGGWGQALYASYGIWFNENDVLHALLILWGVLIWASLRGTLEDQVST